MYSDMRAFANRVVRCVRPKEASIDNLQHRRPLGLDKAKHGRKANTRQFDSGYMEALRPRSNQRRSYKVELLWFCVESAISHVQAREMSSCLRVAAKAASRHASLSISLRQASSFQPCSESLVFTIIVPLVHSKYSNIINQAHNASSFPPSQVSSRLSSARSLGSLPTSPSISSPGPPPPTQLHPPPILHHLSHSRTTTPNECIPQPLRPATTLPLNLPNSNPRALLRPLHLLPHDAKLGEMRSRRDAVCLRPQRQQPTYKTPGKLGRGRRRRRVRSGDTQPQRPR